MKRQDYENLYLGPDFPIGARYSQILTTIFIILIYSSGMPLLYICTFAYFLVTYWVDKVLILRFYRKPPHIDLYISRFFSILILFGVILHYCFAIWMYGDKYILVDNSKTAIESISIRVKTIFSNSKNSLVGNIAERVAYAHNLVLFVFLLLLVIAFVWRLLFMDFLLKACCKCFKVRKGKIRCENIYDSKNDYSKTRFDFASFV